MIKFNWFILLAVAVGAFVPLQASLNTLLGSYMKTPLMATLINFLVGLFTAVIVMMVFFRESFPGVSELSKVPWYGFVAGVLGVLFITTVVVLTPRIGVTNMLAGAMVGQLIMSVIFDHFGWFGMPQQNISWTRILGILFLVVGIWLTQKK